VQLKDVKNLNRLSIQSNDPELNALYTEHSGLNGILVSDLTCPCNHKPLYEQILGSYNDDDDVMAYKTCKHTIFAAAKRQMKAAPSPDPDVLKDFLQYSFKRIEEDIGPYLDNFGYSYNQWFNHLTLQKQKPMTEIETLLSDQPNPALLLNISPKKKKMLLTDKYEGICKVELQHKDGKPRMVCSIPQKTKYIMGPVTWALEEICSHSFKGYCGGKNLTEMANMINEYIDQGFTKVVEGDGSAFDNTQDVTLKAIDRYIYERVEDKIYHVDKKLFHQVSHQLTKTMKLKYLDGKKIRELCEYSITGTVFSGDCDTTLMNTIRMAMYNRYVNDKAGWKYGEDYICFSKGDDFTVMYKPYITDEQIENAYYKYFCRSANPGELHNRTSFGLGQVLKFLEFGPPSIIKFCSLRAWYVDAEHIMLTRQPDKFYSIGKYSIKAKNMSNLQLYVYLNQLAIAIEASYGGMHFFDAVAQSYRNKAKTLNLNQTDICKADSRINAFKNNLVKEKIRVTLDLEKGIDLIIKDIKFRSSVHKMHGTYWETMQSIERVITNKFTPQQLKLINQQMDAEFDVEELKSILGAK